MIHVSYLLYITQYNIYCAVNNPKLLNNKLFMFCWLKFLFGFQLFFSLYLFVYYVLISFWSAISCRFWFPGIWTLCLQLEHFYFPLQHTFCSRFSRLLNVWSIAYLLMNWFVICTMLELGGRKISFFLLVPWLTYVLFHVLRFVLRNK